MSQTVAAGAAYTSRLSLGIARTGLVGTVRYRLLDNDQTADDPIYGPSAATIIEDPSGTGTYVFDGTAPAVAGNYARTWDTGPGTELIFDEDLIVTADALVPFVPTGHEYVTLEELKAILGLTNENFDDLAIAIAIEAASRACDGYKGTRFYAATETRYYSPGFGDVSLALDDLASLTSVEVDLDGDGVFETAWTNGVEFTLYPANSAADARPFRTLNLRQQQVRQFLNHYPGSVKVTGSFGWASTPTMVKQATILLANRLLVRTKAAPLGVLIATAGDAVATAHLGRLDKDVAFLLDQLPGAQAATLQSVQLG